LTIHRLTTPVSETQVRRLRVNDILYLSGTIVTARDQVHRRALEFAQKNISLPMDLEGQAVFHCGPVVRKENGKWVVVAAGPTTSTRMEPFESEFIRRFKPRVIIGKGGMGKETSLAMAEFGAVYGAFTGGAAVLAANSVKNVIDVFWLDLGTPEAMWILEVEELGPLIIAIDSLGINLFRDVASKADANRAKLFKNTELIEDSCFDDASN